MRYTAKTLLWHRKEGRYVQPGEEVDLSHLSREEQKQLVEKGAVEIIRSRKSEFESAMEVRDGTDG